MGEALGAAALAAVKKTDPAKPPVSSSRLPAFLNGAYNWNGNAFSPNVCTENGVQYAVWVNTAKKPVIGKRTLSNGSTPDGPWTTFDLSTVSGNPLGSPIGDNFHYGPRVFVDGTGRIIVTANFHGVDAFKGVRSTNPGDISAWTTMSVPDAFNASYPTVVRLSTGQTIMFMRDGSSGDADEYLYQQTDPTANTWVRGPLIFDGRTSDESPYLNNIAVDEARDRIHVSFTWRGSGLPDTTNDICYAYTDDAGVTWHKSDGTAYTLPITHASAEKIVDTADSGSGLLNQSGGEVDSRGRPHFAYLLNDASGTQIFHYYLDGTTWHSEQVTNLTFTMNLSVAGGYIDLGISRPAVVCSTDGKVWIVYRTRHDGLRGTVRAIEVTPGRRRVEGTIMELDLGDWEPVFDTRAMKDRNELHMLATPVKLAGGFSLEEYYSVTNWKNQFGLLVSYDLNQFREVVRGKIRGPRVQRWARQGTPGGTSVTPSTTTPTEPTGLPLVMLTPEDIAGKFVVARLRCRGKINTGTAGKFTVRLYERDVVLGSGSDVTIADLPFDVTFDSIWHTPWVPLQVLPNYGYPHTGWLSILADVTAPATQGKISMLAIDIGEIVL